MGRNADREMRTGQETGGEMREGQTFYSGISNGGAKSPCNFLSAGRIHPRGSVLAGARARGGKRVYTASTFSAWPRDWS